MSSKDEKIVEMYITARQFKNAVLDEEMIILPSGFGFGNGSILKWGGTKITFRGEKRIMRIFPFVVNKAFACEVYLKILLDVANFDIRNLKKYELHNLLNLYKSTDENFKHSFMEYFTSNFGDQVNNEFLERKLKNISDVFVKWRYIYENSHNEMKVNYGFLNQFCVFLDRYSQKIILSKYNYDVDEDMR